MGQDPNLYYRTWDKKTAAIFYVFHYFFPSISYWEENFFFQPVKFCLYEQWEEIYAA